MIDYLCFFVALSQDSYMDPDDPYPSLSDNHDYEPNLEFDDSELLNTDNSKPFELL